MDSKFGECSLMKEITKTEDAIKTCYKRIASLEKKLDYGDFSQTQEKTVENELMECRKLLQTYEEVLSKLHKHNSNTFVFGVAFCLIIFLVWMLYILVNGNSF